MNKKQIIMLIISLTALLLVVVISRIISNNIIEIKKLDCIRVFNDENKKVETSMIVNFEDGVFVNFENITIIDISNYLDYKDKLLENFKTQYQSDNETETEIIVEGNNILIKRNSKDTYKTEQTYEEMKKEFMKEGFTCK